jgi:hypothetical protein
MRKVFGVGAAALALISLGLAAVPAPAQAAGSVAVLDIAVAGDQATISQSTVRPGVVEFHVGKTFTIPGKDGGPDQLTVLRTDQLDLFLQTVPALFQQSDDAASLAAAAAAERAIHGMGTVFGGGGKGTIWQVRLDPGTYTVLGVQSTAMGLAKPATLTVAGTPRPGAIHATQATIRAVGPVGKNKWTYTQVGSRPVEWLRFANASKELHFLDMSGVKPGTTEAMVRKAFNSPKEPDFFTGGGVGTDVISPGVAIAIKGPLPAGRYLVTCFMPSELDGMPHALMGMWKLVDVR